MYVFLSRTGAGSSVRFAASAAATFLLMQAERRAAAAAAMPPAGVSPTARGPSALSLSLAAAVSAAADDASDYMSPSKRQRLSAGSLLRVESDTSDLVRCVGLCLGGCFWEGH